jgi:hypothetical protein
VVHEQLLGSQLLSSAVGAAPLGASTAVIGAPASSEVEQTIRSAACAIRSAAGGGPQLRSIEKKAVGVAAAWHQD